MKSHQAVDFLHLLCAQAATEPPSAIVKRLRAFRDAGYATPLVRALLTGDGDLHPELDDSLDHENGFLKTIIHSDLERDTRVRLHVWDARQTEHGVASDIHNHTRDFSSLVLTGQIRSRQFNVSPTGQPYFQYEASNRTADKSYLFRGMGMGHLYLECESVLTSGQTHFQPFEKLHQILAEPRQLTATIFVQGPVRCENTQVFTSSEKTSLLAPSHRANVSHITDVFKLLLTALEEDNDE